MRISIVVPSYNQAQFLPYTLDSILQQPYNDIEVVVMDGGSTDGSVEVLENYQDDRIYWESKPDNGQSDAINQGMRRATGEILAYLNSDDTYLDDTIPFVMDYFTKHPNVDYIYGHCHAVDALGERLPNDQKANKATWYTILTKTFKIPQPASFWRRDVYDKIGDFDESMRYRFDYDYWIKIFIEQYTMQLIDRDLATYRFHDSSKSVSETIGFQFDWVKVLDKIYHYPDIPQEVIALKETAYNYSNFYFGESYYYADEMKLARKHLTTFLSGPADMQKKVLAFIMLVDSSTFLTMIPLVKFVYRRAKLVKKRIMS